MVRDIAPCTNGIGAEQQPVESSLTAREGRASVTLVLPAIGADDQFEEVEDRPVLDNQASVHIGFAKSEARVLDDVEPDFAIGESHRQVLPAAASECLRLLARAQQGNAA